MINAKMLGMLVTAFVAGSFLASPELRANAANTVFSADIVDGQVMTADLANNAVTAAKVKDGEIKAAEIATDAVGASELQGVTKLLFGKCVLNSAASGTMISAGVNLSVDCNISGVDTNDRTIATLTQGSNCLDLKTAQTNEANKVKVTLKNECPFTVTPGPGTEVSIIVFDK